MNTDLTLLCVTKGEPYAQPFLDGFAHAANQIGCRFLLAVDGKHGIDTGGYIESVLDDLVATVDTEYVLRLDDDERMTRPMVNWLGSRGYRAHDHWAFRRANLWPTETTYIENAPLWPDLQTRLSVKAKAGGRSRIHEGSPHGTGMVAPVWMEHHKFLVRSYTERRALVDHYETLQPGAGSEFVMFSLPELYEGSLKCRPLP